MVLDSHRSAMATESLKGSVQQMLWSDPTTRFTASPCEFKTSGPHGEEFGISSKVPSVVSSNTLMD